NRDYSLFLGNLDNPTAGIFEAWLEQMESMLAVWHIWRMTDPGFSQRWTGEDTQEEQRSFAKELDKIEGALSETWRIGTSISAALLYAESQDDGDDKLLSEAKALRDGTHVLKNFRNGKQQATHSASDA